MLETISIKRFTQKLYEKIKRFQSYLLSEAVHVEESSNCKFSMFLIDFFKNLKTKLLAVALASLLKFSINKTIQDNFFSFCFKLCSTLSSSSLFLL